MKDFIKLIAGIASNKKAIDDACAVASFNKACDGECDNCPLQSQAKMKRVSNILTNRLG